MEPDVGAPTPGKTSANERRSLLGMVRMELLFGSPRVQRLMKATNDAITLQVRTGRCGAGKTVELYLYEVIDSKESF